MARRGRTKNEIAASRLRLAQMAAEGHLSQFAMAKTLGISESFCSRELKKLRSQWKEESEQAIDIHKAREIAKTFHAEREAWAAWHRSKQDRVETIAESGDRRCSVRKVNRDGSWQFLVTILQAIHQRCRLLGLYAPVRVAHGGDPDVTPIQHAEREVDMRRLSPEDLEILEAIHQRLQSQASPEGGQPRALPGPQDQSPPEP